MRNPPAGVLSEQLQMLQTSDVRMTAQRYAHSGEAQPLTLECPSDQHFARLAHEHERTHRALVQGGGTSVRAAAAAAGLGAEASTALASRIQANPFLKGPAPTFMARTGKASAGAGKAGASSAASAKPRRGAAESGRLQHDDPFSLETL